IAANIPLHKADNQHVRNFLDKHVHNGGSIPKSHALRDRLPQLFNEHCERLKSMLRGKKVSVVLDETTDDRSKIVINILLVIMDQTSSKDKLKPLLVCSEFMDAANHSTVGKQTI